MGRDLLNTPDRASAVADVAPASSPVMRVYSSPFIASPLRVHLI